MAAQTAPAVAAPRPAPIAKAGFSTRDRLHAWGGRTRTPESVRNKIHLNCRHNFREIGRNGAPETFRVRAAALGICSSRKDFGRRFQRGRPNSIAAELVSMPGWSDSNSGMRKENNPLGHAVFCTRLRL